MDGLRPFPPDRNEAGGRVKILIGMPSSDSWGGPAACEPPFVEALRTAGHEVSEFTYVYGDKARSTSLTARIRRVLRSAANLGRALHDEDVDIVHLNTAFDLKTIVRDAYTIWRMPRGRHRLFLKMHGSDAKSFLNSGPIVSSLIRFIARRADAIGVLSSEERGDFVELGFDAQKVYEVSNVVELETSSVESNPREGAVSLLFVSRLVETKGLLETIQAVSILRDDGVAFELTVVGDGDIRNTAEALVQDLGLTKQVVFTGYIPESEVASAMATADVFVFPTRHAEGLPIALYKAAIAGLPIVTTSIRSAKDRMVNGKNCLFCEPEPSDIADKIKRLIYDAELRQMMSENNKKYREIFSRDRVASEYGAIYSELVSN